MNKYPFFIECSKRYQNDPYKQKFLQNLAYGHGIHIIKREDKDILVTANGEFVIPTIYSDKACRDLDSMIWEVNDFTRLGDCIKKTRESWQTTRKKDKMSLLYKYVATLPDLSKSQKVDVCNTLVLALLLKMIKPTDIDYRDNSIVSINKKLFEHETYINLKQDDDV